MFGHKSKRQRQREALDQKKQNLKTAAAANDVAGVEASFMPRQPAYEACLAAIRGGAVEALEKLLEKNCGFDFSDTGTGDSICAQILITEAQKAPANADRIMTALYKANHTGGFGKQPQAAFLSPLSSFEMLQSFLETTPEEFGRALKAVGMAATDKMKFILSFTPKDGSAQQTLDAALIETAANGDVDKTDLLLKHGANPDYAAGRALLGAAKAGHIEIIDRLLPRVDLLLYGEDIATQTEHANPDMAKLVQTATELAREQAAAEKPAAAENAAGVAAAPAAPAQGDMLAETRTLPDGSTLTSVFCFAARQQHNIVRTPEGGVAMTTVAFRNIDKAVIAAMKEKCDARAAQAKPVPANDAPQPSRGQTTAARLKGAGLT